MTGERVEEEGRGSPKALSPPASTSPYKSSSGIRGLSFSRKPGRDSPPPCTAQSGSQSQSQSQSSSELPPPSLPTSNEFAQQPTERKRDAGTEGSPFQKALLAPPPQLGGTGSPGKWDVP